MKVLCPGCSASIEVADTARTLTCDSCGVAADLSQVATSPGGPVTSVTRDLSGTPLGDYALESLIGVGGMGVVYKATRLSDGLTVAVKVLGRAGQLNPDEFVARFKREVKALEQLDHPGIVRILDSGRQGDIHYLVTEYVPGVGLAHHLKTQRATPSEIVTAMIRVADAIGFAHRNGIVHRDIKPANVLVDGDTVKVLDFGLAQLTGTDTGLTTLTRTNLAMGTFNYLSPEQRTNAKAVDERSDLFSLGIVLYELLTGTLPLGTFEPPSKLNKAVDKRIDKVVEKSLRTDPDARYQSADAFARDLARADQRSANWVAPVVGGAIAATIAIGIVGYAMLTPQAPEEIQAPSVSKSAAQSVIQAETTKAAAPQQAAVTPPPAEPITANNAIQAMSGPVEPAAPGNKTSTSVKPATEKKETATVTTRSTKPRGKTPSADKLAEQKNAMLMKQKREKPVKKRAQKKSASGKGDWLRKDLSMDELAQEGDDDAPVVKQSADVPVNPTQSDASPKAKKRKSKKTPPKKISTLPGEMK